MGNESGSSVALKAVLAFLLPLIVFIVSLAAAERLLVRAINIEGAQTALSLLLALLVTFMCIFITRILSKQLGLNK
ncbi:MAG: SoxR reducing system RseC family protein [Planctomycetota bacterium]